MLLFFRNDIKAVNYIGSFFIFATPNFYRLKYLKLILILALATSSKLYSQKIWTNEYERAYEEVLNLNFSKSEYILSKTTEKIDITEAYIKANNFFINLMLNNYSNNVLKNDSISFYLNTINSSELNSPWINYFEVELLTMKSLIDIRLENKMSSAYNIYKASKLSKSTLKEYPNFAPMKTLYGFELCTFSQIPENYKSLASFFGIEGDYKRGIKEIENAIDQLKDGPIKQKSKFIYIFSQKEFGKTSNIRISNYIENYKSSPVMIYYEAYLLYKDNKISKAKELLKNTEPLWKDKFNYLNYFTGKLLAFSIDYTATKYFDTFLKNTKTDYFKQSTYRYLAYLELLRGNKKEYNRLAETVKTIKLSSQSESDKSALNEISDITQPQLIKAQLLFDGGYYSESKSVLLDSQKTNICHSESDFIIYYYRLGSIYYKLGNTELAIQNFERCTKFNFNNKFHYQANAYLHLGELFILKGNTEKSKDNLEMCLDLEGFPYSYSIHNSAKKILEDL